MTSFLMIPLNFLCAYFLPHSCWKSAVAVCNSFIYRKKSKIGWHKHWILRSILCHTVSIWEFIFVLKSMFISIFYFSALHLRNKWKFGNPVIYCSWKNLQCIKSICKTVQPCKALELRDKLAELEELRFNNDKSCRCWLYITHQWNKKTRRNLWNPKPALHWYLNSRLMYLKCKFLGLTHCV